MVRQLLVILFVGSLLLHRAPVAIAQSSELCFQETGYCISGRIRTYWEAQGGLRVFGLPIGAQVSVLVEGKMLTMQQFERNFFLVWSAAIDVQRVADSAVPIAA